MPGMPAAPQIVRHGLVVSDHLWMRQPVEMAVIDHGKRASLAKPACRETPAFHDRHPVRHVGMHRIVGYAETPDTGTIWPGLKTVMARLLVLRRCSIST